ncbi:MAG: hypothetical protein CL676_02490 [Bdellovibrionaceae bacterium]|nr:hypothetical protein [Pseudobdellovibrionaceae bacterium]|tara:strand:- start:16246 stop:17682 length:1437 start_codon:yes stop_codon:yes gene_type:complete
MDTKPKILIVDDDTIVIQSVKKSLNTLDVEVCSCGSIADALSLLKQYPMFVAAFIDHQLRQECGDIELGIELVKRIKALNPSITTIMISGDQSAETLKLWIKEKVDHFVYKPLVPEILLTLAEQASEKYTRAIQSEFGPSLSTKQQKILQSFKMVSKSKDMGRLAQQAEKLAQNPNLSILILGESGTGKELLAKGIHNNSSRKDLPFLALNCTAYGSGSELLESELFGHEKGAFTGADSKKIGMFEAALGGTIFLDEVQNLSLVAQGKILRVLQEKCIRRVGSNIEIPVNVRIIAACKPNILELCESGQFMPDLYYRLNRGDLHIPSLRERKMDIDFLISHFANTYNRPNLKFAPDAYESLIDFSWPGNVRQLESLIEKLCTICENDLVKKNDLPDFKDEFSAPTDIQPLDIIESQFDRLKKISILKALAQTNGNKVRAADILNVKRERLYSTMRHLNILELNPKEQKQLLWSLTGQV